MIDPVPHRLLMTLDAVGGVWTYALDLSAGLARRGTEVTLALMGDSPTPAQRAAAASLPGVELIESDYKLEWMEHPWRDVRAAGRWLLDLARRIRPDLVHLNGYVHAALPFEAPVLVVAHSDVCSWFEAVRGAPAPASWNTYRAAVARGLNAAAAVAAPTAAMLSALRRHYGYAGPGVVIPNGREIPPQGGTPKLNREPFIFTAGRLWDEAKNIAALDKAAGLIPWPVYVAGAASGPGCGPVEMKNLTPLGPLSPAQVSEWMGHAAIYALPALYEPFGLTPLEAALGGCALVLGDIPSLREVWGKAASYVPPRDARALAAALDRLMRDEPVREALAARARVRAAALTAERMVDGYVNLYGQMRNAECGVRNNGNLNLQSQISNSKSPASDLRPPASSLDLNSRGAA